MNCSDVIKPKQSGGLDLGNVEIKNGALLDKWW